MVPARVARQVAGAGRHADQPDRFGITGTDPAGPFKTSQHRRRFEKQIQGAAGVAGHGGEMLAQGNRLPLIQIGSHPAGAHQPAAEAVAAQGGGGIEIIAAQPPAEGRRGEKADVAGKGADVADMVGQPLQLKSHQP